MEQILKNTLLLSDIDGTMVAGGNNIPARNLEAIRRFQQLGGRFAFATGRSRQVAEELRRLLHPNAPCIYLNGACLYDAQREETVAEHFLPPSVRPFLREVFARFPEVGFDLYVPDEIAVLRSNEYSSFHQKLGKSIVTRTVSVEALPMRIYKILMMASAERVVQLRAFYEQNRPAGTDCLTSSPEFFEVMPAGINKGSGLRELCRLLKITRENSFAIGDFENDIEMLAAAGISAAPANALLEVRRRVQWVVGDCGSGAVADFIDKLVEKRA